MESDMNVSHSKLCHEILLRIILFILYIFLADVTPFERKIQPEEMWQYRYPITNSYVPSDLLWPILFSLPLTAIFINYKIKNDKVDVQEALLSFSLSMILTGITTNLIKVIAGQPRPDYFWRCFPSGKMTDDMICNGDESVIKEGRKSFPSGHSSLSFASLGFLTLYLMAKLQVFNTKGRGHGWRIIVCLLPVMIALCIAISRTCDYHHHEKDILVGSLIGIFYSYISYHQYYPSVNAVQSQTPLAAMKDQIGR